MDDFLEAAVLVGHFWRVGVDEREEGFAGVVGVDGFGDGGEGFEDGGVVEGFAVGG